MNTLLIFLSIGMNSSRLHSVTGGPDKDNRQVLLLYAKL